MGRSILDPEKRIKTCEEEIIALKAYIKVLVTLNSGILLALITEIIVKW